MINIVRSFVRLKEFILCESNMDINGAGVSLALVVQEEAFKRYSVLEMPGGEGVKIVKKSLLLPVTHHVLVQINNSSLELKVRMNFTERILATVFFLVCVVTFGALPILAVVLFFLKNSSENIAVFPIIAVVSVLLLMWLKFICFISSWLSGVAVIVEKIKLIAGKVTG